MMYDKNVYVVKILFYCKYEVLKASLRMYVPTFNTHKNKLKYKFEFIL